MFPPHSVVREEEGGMRFNYAMSELMSLFSALNPATRSSRSRCRTQRTTPGSTSVKGALRPPRPRGVGNAIWGELYNLAPPEQGAKVPVKS